MFGTWRVRTILRADLSALAYGTQSSHREILIRHLLDPFLLHLAYVRSAALRSSARRQTSFLRGAGGSLPVALYHFLEEPLIQLGKRVTKKFEREEEHAMLELLDESSRR